MLRAIIQEFAFRPVQAAINFKGGFGNERWMASVIACGTHRPG